MSFPSFRRLSLGLVGLAALLGTTNEASAFCRTTTKAVPANYSPTRGCFTDGLFLFWKNACVGYSIQQEGSRSVPYVDAEGIIDRAFATWTGAACPSGTAPGIRVQNLGPVECSEVRYNPDTPNQNLIVFRDNGWPYLDPNNTLGLTTVTFNADTGEIFDADMEINASDKNLTFTDSVPANGFDLLSVITHEAGHFLGLAHATDTRSTMYASYKPGTTQLRTLTADDVAGLCEIYPDDSTRIVTPTKFQGDSVPAGPCNATPRFGLTTECFVPKPPRSSSCSTTPGAETNLVPFAGLGLVLLLGRIRARASRK